MRARVEKRSVLGWNKSCTCSSMSGSWWRHRMPTCIKPQPRLDLLLAWINDDMYKWVCYRLGSSPQESPSLWEGPAHHILCNVSGGIFCQACWREVLTKENEDVRVISGVWSNWGDDDADEEATVWYREVCGDGQWILCAEGDRRDVSALGVWDDSNQGKKILSQLMQGRCHWGMLPIQGGWGC